MPANRLRSNLIALSLASACAGQAHADIDLIARGSLSGSLSDFSGLSAPLENGLPGNLLGGIGSGLAWAGGNTFFALPDRGPNATRLDRRRGRRQHHDLHLALPHRDADPDRGVLAAGLPFTLTPTLTGTTLLYSPDVAELRRGHPVDQRPRQVLPLRPLGQLRRRRFAQRPPRSLRPRGHARLQRRQVACT